MAECPVAVGEGANLLPLPPGQSPRLRLTSVSPAPTFHLRLRSLLRQSCCPAPHLPSRQPHSLQSWGWKKGESTPRLHLELEPVGVRLPLSPAELQQPPGLHRILQGSRCLPSSSSGFPEICPDLPRALAPPSVPPAGSPQHAAGLTSSPLG